MARPRKYTDAQRKQMRRIWNRDGNRRRRARGRAERERRQPKFVPDAIEIAAVRPPPEVLMERDFRIELLAMGLASAQLLSDPPIGYAPAYAAQAWRRQRQFACMSG